MGKEVSEVPEAAALDAGGGQPAEAIGAYLSRQRKLRRISVKKLSEITRIPVRSLERLESGAFDDVPDGFVRGFVRTVAAALGLDPDDTVARMLPEATSIRGRVPWQGPERHVLWAALGLVVLLAGLGWWTLGRGPAPTRTETSPIVYRYDAVRALAEREGLMLEPVPGESPQQP